MIIFLDPLPKLWVQIYKLSPNSKLLAFAFEQIAFAFCPERGKLQSTLSSQSYILPQYPTKLFCFTRNGVGRGGSIEIIIKPCFSNQNCNTLVSTSQTVWCYLQKKMSKKYQELDVAKVLSKNAVFVLRFLPPMMQWRLTQRACWQNVQKKCLKRCLLQHLQCPSMGRSAVEDNMVDTPYCPNLHLDKILCPALYI